nr:uncharacterized protein LOC123754055 isoform X2 [Procambarus clarkii]
MRSPIAHADKAEMRCGSAGVPADGAEAAGSPHWSNQEGLLQHPKLPSTVTKRLMCSSVKLLSGEASQVNQKVLQELCGKGELHVLLKDQGPPVVSSSPFQEPVKRAEQYAVVNLHRDGFSDRVNWTSGDATNVFCEKRWYVDEEVALTNGYAWYRHGLPMWPLLNQALAPKHRLFSSRTKLDWPNYAIATPLYLVPREVANFRDPRVAIQKLFAGDSTGYLAERGLHDTFSQSAKFQKDIIDLYNDKEMDMNDNATSYSNWLLPLLTRSLPPMINSFKARQKRRASKHSDISTCPDALYVFFLRKPCSRTNTCLLLNELMLVLRTVECSPFTDLVVGYSKE